MNPVGNDQRRRDDFLKAIGGSESLSYQQALRRTQSALFGASDASNQDVAERVLLALTKSGHALMTMRPDRGGDAIPISDSALPDPDEWDGIRQTDTLKWDAQSGYAQLRRGERMKRRGEESLWPYFADTIAGFLQVNRTELERALAAFWPKDPEGIARSATVGPPDASAGSISVGLPCGAGTAERLSRPMLDAGDGCRSDATTDPAQLQLEGDTTRPEPLTETSSGVSAQSDRRRRGRRPTYDWESFQAEIADRVGHDPDGFPVIQADLERQMAEWCQREWGEEHCPSESTIREHVALHYRRNSKAGNST